MTPRPPTAISGNAIASSPDNTRKSAGTARQTSHICCMFPDASFTPTMFGMRRQAHKRRDLDVHARPARDVVDHDRQRGALGNRAVVLVEAFLRRLVVVRRHRQEAVGAGLRQIARELHDFFGVVSAGAGKDGHLAGGFIGEDLDDAQTLGRR